MIEYIQTTIICIFAIIIGATIHKTFCENRTLFKQKHEIEHLNGDIKELKIKLKDEKVKVAREEETVDDLRRDKRLLVGAIESLGYIIEEDGLYIDLKKE